LTRTLAGMRDSFPDFLDVGATKKSRRTKSINKKLFRFAPAAGKSPYKKYDEWD